MRLSQKQKEAILNQMWLLLEDGVRPADGAEERYGITEAQYEEAVQTTIAMLEKKWGMSL
jgi:hypothetical protein